MTVYHITDKEYQPGRIVSITEFTGDSIYHQGLSFKHKRINEYLSADRPKNEPFRQLCLYAFLTPEYCVYFKKKEILDGQLLHLYKCEMDDRQGHPMILVGRFQSVIDDEWDKLRSEYWYPTKGWKVMEYLAEEMQIVGEVAFTQEFRCRSLMKGHLDYADDLDTTNTICQLKLN